MTFGAPYQHNPYATDNMSVEAHIAPRYNRHYEAPHFAKAQHRYPMVRNEAETYAPTEVPVLDVPVTLCADLPNIPISSDLVCLDDPPLSRLFVRCSSGMSAEELRAVFDKFGDIQQLKMINNKVSNKFKGKLFVKYAKASSAALAKEELHGAEMRGAVMYVQMAEPFRSGVDRPPAVNETDCPPFSRLFITCPTDMSNQDLHNVFADFGEVQHIVLLKNRETNTSRGLGFVKYSTAAAASHAASYFMQRDRTERPRILCRIAEPRSAHRVIRQAPIAQAPPVTHQEYGCPPPVPYSYESWQGNQHDASCYGDVCYCGQWDNYMGYEEQQPREWENHYVPEYATHTPYYPESYGVQPPSYPQGYHMNDAPIASMPYPVLPWVEPTPTNIAEEPIASSLDKNATLGDRDNRRPPPLASSKSQQPTVHTSTSTFPADSRLFITFARPLPQELLRAVFSQYGEIASVYLLPERNYGYVQYLAASAAHSAIEALHNRAVAGIACRVLVADPYTLKRRNNSPTPTTTPVQGGEGSPPSTVDRIAAEIEATHKQMGLGGRIPTTPTSYGSSENGTNEVTSNSTKA